MPVILLTANDTEMDVVIGLEHGADDYITKPFSLAILRARVSAQLRRAEQTDTAHNRIVLDRFVFDFDRMEFQKEGQLIELSKIEQKLLRLLVENKGVTLSRSHAGGTASGLTAQNMWMKTLYRLPLSDCGISWMLLHTLKQCMAWVMCGRMWAMIPIKIAVGALLLVVLCCGMLLLWSRYRQRRLLLRLQQMLDEAIAGTFTEHSFDETMLSALESRMADYLSASATTAMQLQKEKDTIKELISDISHQTKTPIANILLYGQLLQEQPLPAESRQCVAALQGPG